MTLEIRLSWLSCSQSACTASSLKLGFRHPLCAKDTPDTASVVSRSSKKDCSRIFRSSKFQADNWSFSTKPGLHGRDLCASMLRSLCFCGVLSIEVCCSPSSPRDVMQGLCWGFPLKF